MNTFLVDTEDGPGAVLTVEIHAVMPCHKPKKPGQCLLITATYPEGLVIKGNPREVAQRWEEQLMALDYGEDSDEEGEECED